MKRNLKPVSAEEFSRKMSYDNALCANCGHKRLYHQKGGCSEGRGTRNGGVRGWKVCGCAQFLEKK